MATIDIRRPHKLSKDAAREKAEGLARTMEEKIGVKWRWDRDVITFDVPSGAAKGTSGKVSVSDNEVHVAIDLPFLLRPMKGMVETKVKERLERALG